MLSDPDGEPSLGSLYRQLVSRLARAIQRAGASKFNQQDYHQLDEIRIKLEAWADLVGVKKDVLEAVDEDGGPLAITTRDSFVQLLDAMDHVEVKLGLREEPSDGLGMRPDPLTYFRILFQTSLMDRTGHFAGYASAPRRAPVSHQFSRSSDSPTTGGSFNPTRSMSRASNRRSAASTPKESLCGPSFPHHVEVEMSPAETTLIKVETPATNATLLDSCDVSRSRPSTAESARRMSTSALYPISPPSGYPSISQLFSSPTQPDKLLQQTPSTASSSSSPPTPWTPYQPIPSSFATSPALVRQIPHTTHEAWSGVVLNPILDDKHSCTARTPQPGEGLRPMEPPMQPSYNLSAELEPGFKSEGWLAGDYPRSGGSPGGNFMSL